MSVVSRLAPLTKREVPLDECVHYCGFRYARNEYNPYETYQVALQQGVPLVEIRRQFIDFLRYYRPRNFADALGITLNRSYGLWAYPFTDIDPRDMKRGWCENVDDCPDILTHFCEAGISSRKIEQEFLWLESILVSMANQGYQPQKYESAVALQFERANGEVAYLLRDGNHRAGALTALGFSKTISVAIEKRIREVDVDRWRSVRNGWMTREDAQSVFLAYFNGTPVRKRSTTPAPIVGPSGWEKLYF